MKYFTKTPKPDGVITMKQKKLSTFILSLLIVSGTQLLCAEESIQKSSDTTTTIESPGQIEVGNLSLNEEEFNQLKQLLVEEYDTYMVRSLDQLRKTDAILEELQLIVNNGLIKLKEKKDKIALIGEIKRLRQFIADLEKMGSHAVTESKINLAIHLNAAVITHVYNAVRNGFKKLPPFKFEDALPTKTYKDPFEGFEVQLKKNEKLLKNLENASKNVGLSWLNRSYRFFINSTKKARRYSVATRTAEVALLGAATFYMLYRFTPWIKNLKFGKTPTVGEAPKISRFGHVENWEKLGPLGQLEYYLSQFKSGFMPIGSLFTWLIPKMAKSEWGKFNKWSSKRLERLHRKLLGGVANKKQSKYGLKPRFTFDHVVGLDHIKKELKTLVKYLANPARFERTGNVPEKGYIFTGRPGTGKSFVAEALAGELETLLKEAGKNADDFKFLTINAEDINEHGIDTILDIAQDYAPCIIFIDEIDLLGLQRTEEREKLNKFLTAMTLSNNSKDQVVLLAATNRPENLDPALLRFGRFGKKLHFEYPTFTERKLYLVRRLNPIVADITQFDLGKIARDTEGYTHEALNAIIRAAFQKTIIRGETLTQEDLEDALNAEIRHIIVDETRTLPEHETKIMSVHQAACAVTSILLDPYQKISCVTIQPVMKHIEEKAVWHRYYKKQESEIQHGKLFTYRDSDTINIDTKEDQLTHCKINLAGSIGEELLDASSGNSYNKESNQQALEIALSIVSEGLDLEKLPKKTQDHYYTKALALIKTCKEEVKALLSENKQHLENIARELAKHKTLNASELRAIMQHGSLDELENPTTEDDLFGSLVVEPQEA